MADQPNDRHHKCNHQDNEDNPAFAPLFAQGAPSSCASRIVTVTFVLQGNRGVETAATLARAHEQFLPLLARHLFGHTRRVRDYALKFFHLIAKLRFPAGEILFALIKRAGRPT
jgi:hypothetical protein